MKQISKKLLHQFGRVGKLFIILPCSFFSLLLEPPQHFSMRIHVVFIVAIISLAVAKPLPQELSDQDAQNTPINTDEIAASLSPGSGSGSIFANWNNGGDQPAPPADEVAAALGEQPALPADPNTPVLAEQSVAPGDSTATSISEASGLNALTSNTLLSDAKVSYNHPYEYVYDKSMYGYLANNDLMPVPNCPKHYEGTCCMNGDALAGARTRESQIVV